MTAWQSMFKGNYIAATEFDGKKPTVTIKSVVAQEVESEDGVKKEKMVIYFEGWKRAFIPCKTNAMCLAGMFGDHVEKWIGRRVTLYATMVQFGKKQVPGIRILGSPDIPRQLQVEIKLPKKKAQHMTMQVTKPNGGGAVPAEPAAPTPPPPTNNAPPLDEPPPDMVLPGQRTTSTADDDAERFANL